MPPGRPSRLTPAQSAELRAAVTAGPPAAGGGEWTGGAVSEFVARRWGVVLGLRQAQRLLAPIRGELDSEMRKTK